MRSRYSPTDGSWWPDTNSFGLALARYRPDGHLDRTFSGNGRIGPVVWCVFAGAVALQPDGRDPTIPRAVRAEPPARRRHRDTSFGVNGEVTTFFEGGARAHGSAIDADGRIVVVGGSGEGTIRSFALARYIV